VFQYSHFLGVRDIAASEQQRQLHLGHRNQAHEYHPQNLMCDPGRELGCVGRDLEGMIAIGGTIKQQEVRRDTLYDPPDSNILFQVVLFNANIWWQL
jgi:hypothetical protein